jgi:hypothetical protein
VHHGCVLVKKLARPWEAVVIPLMTQHYAMLQRNLLYTSITRGKRLVVLVGQKKAVAIAVKNVSGRRRWSKLREWLGGSSSECPYGGKATNSSLSYLRQPDAIASGRGGRHAASQGTTRSAWRRR